MSNVKKMDYVDEQAFVKDTDENLIMLQLKDQRKIYYVIDRLTMKDARQRLQKSLFGVLKLDDSNKIDLNQVQRVLINNKNI